jgi:hypothetical protein
LRVAIEHVLALLILVGRAGDVLSTHIMTPTMVLEANPIARRFKGPTFALGFLLCAVPYYDVPLGVMVAVPSLLVSASNISRAWMARALGEREMEALVLRAAERSSLVAAITLVWIAACFYFVAAGTLIWLASDDLVLYFGLGIGLFGFVFAFHSTLFFVQIFRRVRAA